MSVCPKCNTIYTGTLRYCSVDGAPLISCSDEVYLPIGEIINDSISIVARLRTDRLGVVYQGADKINTGNSVCLRLFHPGVAIRAAFDGLEKLGVLLRDGLDCSEIVTNYIVIELDDGRQALVSDFCPGDMLDNILSKEAPLPAKMSVSILLQLAEILTVAHSAGFVHGGLTPENVLVTEETSGNLSIWPKSSQFKLVDFGIGRTIGLYNPAGLKRDTGELKLRNYSTYYSPEVLHGHPDQIDLQSDVYSLGALCYHMLSGRPPFVNENNKADAATYIIDDPRPLLMLPPELEVPRSLETLVLKSLSRDLEARPASIPEFIEELQDIYFNLSVLAPSNSKHLKKSPEREKMPTSELIKLAAANGEGSPTEQLIEQPDESEAPTLRMQKTREREKMPTSRLSVGEDKEANSRKIREKIPTRRIVEKDMPALHIERIREREKKATGKLVEKPKPDLPTLDQNQGLITEKKKGGEEAGTKLGKGKPSTMAAPPWPGEIETEAPEIDSMIDLGEDSSPFNLIQEPVSLDKLTVPGMPSDEVMMEPERVITGDLKENIDTGSLEPGPQTGDLSGKYETIRGQRIKIKRKPKVKLTYWLMFASAGFALLLVVGILAVAYFKPAVGSIVITTAPSGAYISLDGRNIGQAPAEIEEVPEGPHKIVISKEGFNSIEKDVVVEKNQTVNLPIFSLQLEQPPITVEGTPEERITEFNRLAEAAFMRGDLITPEGNNALYLSNAVLQIDSNDEQSLARISKIREGVLKQAEVAQKNKDFVTARQIFIQLVEKFPDDKQIMEASKKLEDDLASRRDTLSQLLKDGEAAFSSGRLIEPIDDNAYYYARQMLGIEWNNPQALKLRARVKDQLVKETEQMVARGDLKGAAEKYEKLGRLFQEDKQLSTRAKSLKEKLAQQPTTIDPVRQRELGIQKYNSGDYSGAMVELEQAVKAGSKDAETLYYLGSAEWKSSRTPEAMIHFSQALDQNPKHVPSLTALGQIAESKNQGDVALSYYERAVKAGGGGAELQKKIDQLKPETVKQPQPQPEKLPEPFTAKAIHRHGVGSCKGTLVVNAGGVHFTPDKKDGHTIDTLLNEVSKITVTSVSASYDEGKKHYDFDLPRGKGEAFHKAYYDFYRIGTPGK